MCLNLEIVGSVPEETVRIALAAFPKGNLYMRMRDELGTIFNDQQFADLFPPQGQPARTPWQLALVTRIGNGHAVCRRAFRPTSSRCGSQPNRLEVCFRG